MTSEENFNKDPDSTEQDLAVNSQGSTKPDGEETMEEFNIFSHLDQTKGANQDGPNDGVTNAATTSEPFAATAAYAAGAYSYSKTNDGGQPHAVKNKNGRGLRTLAGITLVSTLVASAVGAGVGYEVAKNSTNSQAPVIKQVTATPLASATSSSGTIDVPQLLSQVEPAVVDINTTGYVSTPSNGFFGGYTSSQFQAAGTGMIISPNGYVLTNNHVIANASSITVTLYNSKKTYKARVIGANPTHDVALIQIQGASNLPTVTLGNSNTVKVGDPVVAIGNALALQGTPTVTEGIVSALGRTVQAQNETGATETLYNMIQTDAPINPGNSGGPLLNAQGYVIGMNTAAATGAGGSQSAQGIGFAEPINSVLAIVKQIEAHPNTNTSVASHGFLGVGVQNLTASLASQLGYPSSTEGVLVDNVVANSPAMAAGIQSGDVIQSVGSTKVTDINQLVAAIDSKSAGSTVTVTWLDPNTGQNSATVTLAAAPAGA